MFAEEKKNGGCLEREGSEKTKTDKNERDFCFDMAGARIGM